MGGDTCSYPFFQVYGHRPAGPESAGAGLGKDFYAKFAEALLFHGDTDKPAPVFGHKVYRLRRDESRRHEKVAFVLAALIIYDDDHLALADIGYGFFYRIEHVFSKKNVPKIYLRDIIKQGMAENRLIFSHLDFYYWLRGYNGSCPDLATRRLYPYWRKDYTASGEFHPIPKIEVILHYFAVFVK